MSWPRTDPPLEYVPNMLYLMRKRKGQSLRILFLALNVLIDNTSPVRSNPLAQSPGQQQTA